MRDQVDRLKGKVEKVRKEVSVRSKNRVKGGRSGNGVKHDRLNNVKTKNKEGTGNRSEWIKIKGGSRKMVENPKCVDLKNRFNILDQMDEENNIARHMEDGTNDIVLGDSQV